VACAPARNVSLRAGIARMGTRQRHARVARRVLELWDGAVCSGAWRTSRAS
jgi:hypothetical protein